MVDRELEIYIINKLYEAEIGPKLYETDMKTYRVEEYLSDYISLEREDLYKPGILNKFYDALSLYNSLGDHTDFDENLISKNFKKDKIFDLLKSRYCNKSNLVDLILNKMLPEADKSLTIFNEAASEHKELLTNDNEFKQRLDKINNGIKNYEKAVFNLLPEHTLFVLSHNDLHMLNMMKKQDDSKIVIFDHEYSCFNFLGFDICNYICETFFCMTHNEFPFYKTHNSNFREYGDEMHYKVFLDYIDKFFANHSKEYENLENFEMIKEKIRTKDYYLRMIGMSAMLWFVFAILYLNYETNVCKNNTDFFYFAFERISIYEDFIKDSIVE
jgi:thiamine kinase-like enzyme